MEAGFGRLFKHAKDAASNERSYGCGGDNAPALVFREKVASASTRAAIEQIASQVGHRLKERVERGMGCQMHAG